MLAMTCSNMAKVFAELKNYSQAVGYAERALMSAYSDFGSTDQLIIFHVLSRLYSHQNQ